MKTIILAGGRGTRLFPLSREDYPKQFLRFNGQSLFQMAVKRALLISKPDDIYIVTNKKYESIILQHLSEINVSAKIVTEPMSRNTLPAIYMGMKKIFEDCGSSKVAVLPSDHVIDANEEFVKAFKNAEKLSNDYLITFGIKPTKPHTGYGYIKPSRRLRFGFKVEKFIEKPDLESAKRYVKEGYLWNSGMFVFTTELFFEECKKYASDIVKILESECDYSKLPDISVDKGVLEKSNRVAVIPLSVYWNDLGSYDAIYEILEKDPDGNAVKGEFIGIDSKDNLIISDGLVTAVDVRDIVLVKTKDVTLVCSRGSTQKVRDLFNMLKERGDERVDHHVTVYRPWGSYTVLEEGSFYKIKRITVLPKKRLSLQMHYHRSEYWVVVKGTAKVTVGEREFLLKRGESTYIPAGTKHRLENPGLLPLEIIEIQIGEYLGEDDIIRFADDYGRV